MWMMEPVWELTIVRTSFNFSPQEGQVLCVVSLSKTATFSPRNKSMVAPLQVTGGNDSPCVGKMKRDYLARNHFRSKRCLPASQIGQAVSYIGYIGRNFRNAASDGPSHARINATIHDVSNVCHKLDSM